MTGRVGTVLLILPLSIGTESVGYPASWKVFLAAIDAGVQEESRDDTYH